MKANENHKHEEQELMAGLAMNNSRAIRGGNESVRRQPNLNQQVSRAQVKGKVPDFFNQSSAQLHGGMLSIQEDISALQCGHSELTRKFEEQTRYEEERKQKLLRKQWIEEELRVRAVAVLAQESNKIVRYATIRV